MTTQTLRSKVQKVKRLKVGLFLLLAFLTFHLFTFSFAQSNTDLARQAVKDWQAGKYTVDPTQALGKSPEEMIKTLERNLAFSPPPSGISINFSEPLEEKTQTGTIVKFPAVVDGQGGDVRVTVRGGEVTRIGFAPEGGMLPEWVDRKSVV